MPLHDVYSIPPPQFPSHRWDRLANRSLSTKERPKVQMIAVAFIFLLLTGPVYWIHPPRFDLSHRRLAGHRGDVRPGLSMDEAAAVIARRGQLARGSGGAHDGHAGVLHLSVKLPPRERMSHDVIAAARRSFGDVVRSARGKPRGGGGGVDIMPWSGAHVKSEILVDESWGSPAAAAAAAGAGGEGSSMEALRREFHVQQVTSSCDSNPLLALCCGLLGELEFLLDVHRKLPSGARSVACIHHLPGNTLGNRDGSNDDDNNDGGDGSCGRDDSVDSSLAPMLSADLPNTLLLSASPTFVGHTHCGGMFVHNGGVDSKPYRPAQRYPGFAYCVNSALLDVVARKARRLRAIGSKLRQGCQFLDTMKLGGDAPKRLGAVRFMDKVLRLMGT